MKILRFLLFPFSILYGAITSIRNYLFDVEVLKSTSFNIPVIAVGNLSVGGTGKTPQIEYLIRLLKKDYKVAILSRGYKRKTKGFQIVNNNHTAQDVGDEPLQFFKKFNNIIVAVDADRVNGVNQLLKTENPPNIVLLDDAFQHRKVKAGLYILLTKYNDLYIDDFILPTGNLRESRRGAKRADIVIVTKCPTDLSTEKQNEIKQRLKLKNQKVFFTSIEYDENLKGKKELTITDLKEKEIVLVTGIANPNPLLKYLSSNNINYKHLKYPDHYSFSNSDIEIIKQTFNKLQSENKIILTTEKDYMRLKNKVDNLYYISIKTKFLANEYDFNNEIIEFVK